MIGLIISLSVILILLLIALGGKIKHYYDAKAEKSLIFKALSLEVGKTTFKEVKEVLGTNYIVMSDSNIFKRIRYNISDEDKSNYKKRKYKNCNVIQIEIKQDNLFKVEVL